MNILLTGATGYLGSKLLSALVEDGHNVTILVRKSSSTNRISSLLNRINVYTIESNLDEELFRSTEADTIIHCATNYGRGNSDPLEILDANLVLPLQLLLLGRRSGIRCFINTDTILDKNVSDYAMSKGHFREWLRTYSKEMVCVNVALEHFYGPSDDPTKFVSFIVKQLLEETETIDLTLGEQKRDFIHIDDVVSAFKLIVLKSGNFKNGFINYEIGTGKNISIREFVELAKQISGNTVTRLDFGAIPYRENEVMETSVDLSGISELGWKPLVTLAGGLIRMIYDERENRGL